MTEVWGEAELGVGEEGSGVWESSLGVKGVRGLGNHVWGSVALGSPS